MTAASRDLRSVTQPRRGLRRVEAAIYVRISPTKFDEMVKDGRMPRPKRIDGAAVWDQRRLDLAFETLPRRRGPRASVRREVGKPLPALKLVPVVVDRQRAERMVRGDGDRDGRVDARQLLDRDRVRDRVRAGSRRTPRGSSCPSARARRARRRARRGSDSRGRAPRPRARRAPARTRAPWSGRARAPASGRSPPRRCLSDVNASAGAPPGHHEPGRAERMGAAAPSAALPSVGFRCEQEERARRAAKARPFKISPEASMKGLDERRGATSEDRRSHGGAPGLRAIGASPQRLETNRVELVDAQWSLSHALIKRHYPAVA